MGSGLPVTTHDNETGSPSSIEIFCTAFSHVICAEGGREGGREGGEGGEGGRGRGKRVLEEGVRNT